MMLINGKPPHNTGQKGMTCIVFALWQNLYVHSDYTISFTLAKNASDILCVDTFLLLVLVSLSRLVTYARIHFW